MVIAMEAVCWTGMILAAPIAASQLAKAGKVSYGSKAEELTLSK